MLSRVADSIYWMSRYIERAESVARFIDVNFTLSLDLPAGTVAQWYPLVVTSGDQTDFNQRIGRPTMQNVIHFLTFDQQNPNSIISCLTSARENARSIREVISQEMWEHVNRFYLMLRDAAQSSATTLAPPPDFFTGIRAAGQQFVGVTDATMTHGEGWHFCRLGRLLERADKTTRILDVKYFILLPSVTYVGSPYDDLQWAALLRSASAFEMYRQRWGMIRPDRVVAFLVLDKEFPRAVLHCLTRANESLHAISGTSPGSFVNAAEQRLGQLRAELAYARAEDIIGRGLHEFLDTLQTNLNGVGDAIFRTFFELRPVEAATRTQPRHHGSHGT